MTQLANFVEVFSRKGFHLRQWDRRKFCFDFVGLLLQKFGSKSAAMDILLVLIRNSSVEAFKPACFRSESFVCVVFLSLIFKKYPPSL
jgi:hypothetical protein